MSRPPFERRADTGFSTAQLGLYLFLAADAMFYGALYSSYALLRTSATAWVREHPTITIVLGGVALVALLNAALLLRLSARPWRNSAIASLVAGLALIGLSALLWQQGGVPAKSTYLALLHLFAAITALHALGGAVAAPILARRDAQEPHAARRGLLSTYLLVVTVFWGLAWALAVLV